MSIRRLARFHTGLWRRRYENWCWDREARRKGYCNDKPWRSPYGMEAGTGAFMHWRCALLRGHDGRHRYINYTWETNGRVTHEPMISTGMAPKPTRERHAVPTWREARKERQWLRHQYAKVLSKP